MNNKEKIFYQNAKKLRLKILEMVKKSNGGHIGGAFSVIDILNYLYNFEIKHFPKDPISNERIICFLAKAIAVLLYILY